MALREILSGMFHRKDRTDAVHVQLHTPVNGDTHRPASIHEIKQGYGEVIQTMASLRQHLDEQSQRSDQMLRMMDGLPELLRPSPSRHASRHSSCAPSPRNSTRRTRPTATSPRPSNR